MLAKVLCFIVDHKWGGWCSWPNAKYEYRQCERCRRQHKRRVV